MQDWADYCEHVAGDVVPLRQGASAQCQAGRPSGGSLSRPLAIVEAKRCPTNDRTNFITTIARLGQCCCPVAHRGLVAIASPARGQ